MANLHQVGVTGVTLVPASGHSKHCCLHHWKNVESSICLLPQDPMMSCHYRLYTCLFIVSVNLDQVTWYTVLSLLLFLTHWQCHCARYSLNTQLSSLAYGWVYAQYTLSPNITQYTVSPNITQYTVSPTWQFWSLTFPVSDPDSTPTHCSPPDWPTRPLCHLTPRNIFLQKSFWIKSI